MRSDKRGGSLTKSSLFPFCIRPPIQLYCGLKGFQNCKCTVHYAPCLWRNTSTSRSKFKETPFKVKWQGKYWSNWFCSIHVHSILISLTFFFKCEILLRRPEPCSNHDHSTDSIVQLSNSLCAPQISLQHKQNLPTK